MIPRVLHILRAHRPRRVPVATLAGELGEPAAAVQAALAALPAAGFQLSENPIEGVGLADVPQPMLAEELADANRRIGRRVIVLAETGSTNDVAFSHAADPAADGLAVFAERQTAGRGRRGAAWLAPPRSSILFSFLLGLPLGAQAGRGVPTHRLVLAAAVAVAEALHETAGLHALIKWPNDVLVDDRKIAGILVEGKRGPGVVCRNGPTGASHKRLLDPFSLHVIGIGVNVHQRPEDFPAELARIATSVRAAGGRVVDRVLLARDLLDRLDAWVAHAAAAGGAEALHDAWRARSATVGRRVELLHDQRTYTGTVLDIAPDTGLIVRLDAGGVRTFEPATVHVLGTK